MEKIRLGKYTDADAARADILEKDLCALFLYTRNVLCRGKQMSLSETDASVRAVAVSSEMYVPLSFFARFGFAEEKDNCLTASGHTLEICAEGVVCISDGKDTGSVIALTEENGQLYVPILPVCRMLGISAACFDGKFVVLASEDILRELALCEGVRECLTYRLFGDYGVNSLTSEDLRAVKDKWRLYLVGSKEVNDLSDPYVLEKIQGIDAACESHLARMNRNEDAVILFGSEAPSVSADLLVQYTGVCALARAFGTYGSGYYGDESVRDAALYGLKWMYEHMYGEAEMEERGWRSAHAYDWWHWYVGGVEPMTDAMFILEDYLTEEQKNMYLRCFRWVMTFMRTGYREDMAMSRIRVCTKAALLIEDRDMLYDRYLDYDLLLTSDRTCMGIRSDFIAWTHGYPYNMMYGFNHLSRTMYMGAMLAGTPAEFPCPKQYILYEAAKYMFEPLIYRGRGPRIFNGRGYTQPEWSMGAHTIRCLLPMIGFFGADEDAHLKRMIKRNSCMPEVINAVRRACSFTELYLYNSILNDETVDGSPNYEIAHSYYTADRAVQQKNDYSFIIALTSTRHPAYESINGNNKLGWYTGDGALYLYTRHDPYAFDPESFLYNEKCAYNVPGTTVDTQKRVPWSHRSGIRGSRDFAGTMRVGESYIAAAMEYAAYDYNGKTEPPTDGNYGGGFLKHKNDLIARKAYFCLEDGCLMLGAGITSGTGYPVKTVVENRPLIREGEQGIGCESTATDSGVIPTGDFPCTPVSNVKWIYAEDSAGYVFLEPAVLSMEKYSCTEGASYLEGGIAKAIPYAKPRRFFNISIEHGANPKDASYAYMVFPYATREKLAQFAADPDVRILSNTPSLQAIAYDRANTRIYVFYEAGEYEEIRVSAPCMLSVEEKDGGCILTVCEPTQKVAEVIVTLSGRFEQDGILPEVEVYTAEKTEIRVRTENAVGYNFRISLLSRA